VQLEEIEAVFTSPCVLTAARQDGYKKKEEVIIIPEFRIDIEEGGAVVKE